MQIFKLSFGCFLEFQEAIQKWPIDNLKGFASIFALASVLV